MALAVNISIAAYPVPVFQPPFDKLSGLRNAKAMPHVIIEYSANLPVQGNFPAFFNACHALLAQALPTDIQSCKSRAVRCDDWAVGTHGQAGAFLHASIRVMPGRSAETLQNTAEQIKQLITTTLLPKDVPCQLSVEIRDLATYVKTTIPE